MYRISLEKLLSQVGLSTRYRNGKSRYGVCGTTPDGKDFVHLNTEKHGILSIEQN